MKYLIPYKGKHFILGDEPDEMYGEIGTIDDDRLTEQFLTDHIEACLYYGIPPYLGDDSALKERIDLIEVELRM